MGLTSGVVNRVRNSSRCLDGACGLALVGLAILVGMLGVSDSGPLWPDAPQYANGGAMIRDWLVSGEYLHPYEFALKNYSQYPFFSIPYHPPGYPGLLGIWFIMVGTSYSTARFFTAMCLGVAACSFFAILRRQGLSRAACFAGTLLLITTPEIARWSRCTMSEIPALAFLVAATYAFLRYLDTRRGGWCWAAFLLAEIAFFCRVTTAGLLPVWFVFLLLRRNFRRLLTPGIVAASLLYAVVNAAWVKLVVGRFATYELNAPMWHVIPRWSWKNLEYYPAAIPQLVGWPLLLAAVIGTCILAYNRLLREYVGFWLSWLLCTWAFYVVLNVHEPRYFTFALPAFSALAVGPLLSQARRTAPKALAMSIIGVAALGNCLYLSQVPQGVVGTEALAERLAELEQPGNVLLAHPWDSDLAFRLRGQSQKWVRRMIRADRTLAIRTSEYTGIAPTMLATCSDDVLNVIARGRVRYIVTCTSSSTSAGALPLRENRTPEQILAHSTLSAQPDVFELLGEFDLRENNRRYQKLFLWRFRGEVKAGSSELPVVVPTSGIEIDP